MTKEHRFGNRMSSADRQRQLLEVAVNAFSRRGFKGTTTKEIAVAAGVAEAVIFQHFPSKEALYSAVLELHLDTGDERKWMEEINACMDRNDDEGLCRSFIRRILHRYHIDPLFQRVILFAALEGHEQGLARLHKQFEPILERFKKYIARRQREGALIQCDPHAMLISLGGIAHQYGLITQIFRAPNSDVSDDEVVETFTRILLHGVQAARPGRKKNVKNQPAKQRDRKAKK